MPLSSHKTWRGASSPARLGAPGLERLRAGATRGASLVPGGPGVGIAELEELHPKGEIRQSRNRTDFFSPSDPLKQFLYICNLGDFCHTWERGRL